MSLVDDKRKILLHTCCAPCISHVYELLKESFEPVAFYFNPNIAPEDEYLKRFHELQVYSEKRGFPLIEGEYRLREWVRAVRDYRFYGERSPRCWICYRIRLEETFKKAEALGIDIVATVLSISPHKDAVMINRIGRELAGKYGIEFFEADFKKNNGFKKSVELSKANDFYRQEYCGCIYSKMERDRTSRWSRKVAAFRKKMQEEGTQPDKEEISGE